MGFEENANEKWYCVTKIFFFFEWKRGFWPVFFLILYHCARRLVTNRNNWSIKKKKTLDLIKEWRRTLYRPSVREYPDKMLFNNCLWWIYIDTFANIVWWRRSKDIISKTTKQIRTNRCQLRLDRYIYKKKNLRCPMTTDGEQNNLILYRPSSSSSERVGYRSVTGVGYNLGFRARILFPIRRLSDQNIYLKRRKRKGKKNATFTAERYTRCFYKRT